MIFQDSRKGNDTQPCSDFSRGTLLIKEIDPNNFFIKTDEADEGNAVYLDNGELFFVGNDTPCCTVHYQFIIEN